MKRIKILIGLVFLVSSCEGQIYQDLEGCWLPEAFVMNEMKKDTINIMKHLFPIEAFEINKKESQKFASDYASDLNYRDTVNVDDFILIRTYRSEFNSYTIDKVRHEGKIKYKIRDLYKGLNMKYILSKDVNRYKKSDIYISKIKNKLLLEIVEGSTNEKIHFVNGVGEYKFKNIDDAMRYIKNVVDK